MLRVAWWDFKRYNPNFSKILHDNILKNSPKVLADNTEV